MRKWCSSIVKKTCVVFLCILFLGYRQLTFAQSSTHQEEKKETPKREQKYPKKRKNRETWETLVSLPGMILFLPLRIIFLGSQAAATFLSEDKSLRRINDLLNSDDGIRSALPEYSELAGFGMVYTHRDLITDNSKLKARASLGLRFRRQVEVSLLNIQLSNAFYSDIIARYRYFSDEPFYGYGNNSHKDNKGLFAHRQVTFAGTLGYRANDRVSIHSQIGYETNTILESDNESLSLSHTINILKNLYRTASQNSLSKFNLAFHYDGKNHIGRPTAGMELLISSGVYNDFKNDDFGFWKASVDFSKYLRLFHDRILVIRVKGELTEPFSGKDIPFYYLSELGNRETVRGFRRGRFRDRDMILGSLEYRYPIWHLFDALLFIDAGKVSEDIFAHSLTRGLHYGYGAGIRIWGEKGMIAKIEIAKSRDGFRVSFVLGKGVVG